MPFNTELTRALGIRGRFNYNAREAYANKLLQYPLSRVVCNGWATQSSPVPSAMLEGSE